MSSATEEECSKARRAQRKTSSFLFSLKRTFEKFNFLSIDFRDALNIRILSFCDENYRLQKVSGLLFCLTNLSRNFFNEVPLFFLLPLQSRFFMLKGSWKRNCFQVLFPFKKENKKVFGLGNLDSKRDKRSSIDDKSPPGLNRLENNFIGLI